MLVTPEEQHEVAPQLGPAPSHKVGSVEVKVGLSRNEDDVEALDEADGVHLAVLDVCPHDHVASVDVPDLQRPVLCPSVHVASINGSAYNLSQSNNNKDGLSCYSPVRRAEWILSRDLDPCPLTRRCDTCPDWSSPSISTPRPSPQLPTPALRGSQSKYPAYYHVQCSENSPKA